MILFQLRFRTKSVTDYGTLALKISLPAGLSGLLPLNEQYIVQLIDDKENIYRQVIVVNDTTLRFEYLQPRIYKLKLIDDANSNGQWDTGNYLQHLKPEKTLYYGTDINVRANWDVDISWNLK